MTALHDSPRSMLSHCGDQSCNYVDCMSSRAIVLAAIWFWSQLPTRLTRLPACQTSP